MASGDTIAKFFPEDNCPPASNPATFAIRNGHPVLEFDPTTQEIAIFRDILGRNYGAAGLIVTCIWMTAGTTNTIGWDATFERCAAAGQDLDSDGFATAQTITAATVPGTSGQLKYTSVTCANGAAGTDSLAVGEYYRLRIRRDVANDNCASDAQLVAVEVREA